jgi:hypothetical protein
MAARAGSEAKFSPGKALTELAVDAALEEMLFTGGALNRRLLGGGGVELSANRPAPTSRMYNRWAARKWWLKRPEEERRCPVQAG